MQLLHNTANFSRAKCRYLYIFLGNDDVAKLNLMLAHKDEIIKLKDETIESLRNEISLLKEKLANTK
ncbi:hypothetical protein ACWIVU_01140 [Ursidibacter arcticus]